ncbi:hypothetical protein [Bdellovibrio sp. BCCA]|uniref:hypothetical protein n=1 Tax=Bdellovibrio sp. BCCA TaxID=3136281 RepID=UPI0030F187DC
MIDRFVHLSTKDSHSSNGDVDNTEFNETTGKMTMVLINGRVVRKKLNNFTQYARPLISTARKEDEVMIQIVLMMDHAEEILFSECVNEIS